MPASASALDVSAVQSYASLSRRVTAYLLDLVIMLCVLMLVSITLRILNAFGLWTSLGGATGGNQFSYGIRWESAPNFLSFPHLFF